MTTLEQELALVADALDQHLDLAADHAAHLLAADGALELHELAVARGDGLLGDLLFERARARAFFVGVLEHADAVELGPLHEVAQLFEVFFGLARDGRR